MHAMDAKEPKVSDFVRRVVVNGNTQQQAYADTLGRPLKPGDASRASKLMASDVAQLTLEQIKSEYKNLAIKGIQKQVEMLDDSLTPPAVKNDIAKHFQHMAELEPKKSADVDARQVHIYQGLSDPQSKKELLEKVLESL